MRNLSAKVPEDVWPEFKARASAAYQAPSRAMARGPGGRRLKIIPNAFGEKPLLKLMFAAMTCAAERWRAVKITDFERRQMTALRTELDQEYEATTGLTNTAPKVANPANLSSKSQT